MVAEPSIVGPCANHPHTPGAWLLNGTSMLCDPCYFRSRAFTEIAAYLDVFPQESAKIAARLVRRYLSEGPVPDLPDDLIDYRVIPVPAQNSYGQRRWRWLDGDERPVAIDGDEIDGMTASIHCGDGAYLNAAQCREMAAVLLKLADEKR